MRTFTYAGPDGIEIPEFFSAEWLVLEDRSGELVTPPDVAQADGPLLARRVPQAHLAPELRRSGQGPAAAQPDGPLPDAADARAALSRYQASRQAARAMVEEGADPERPASGGWS